MKIYGDKQSGNCYKVQLVAALLNINYEWVDVDILAEETHSDDFLKKIQSRRYLSLNWMMANV